MFHSLEFQFQKTGEKFHDYFFSLFRSSKKSDWGTLLGPVDGYLRNKKYKWGQCFGWICYPAVEPQYFIIEFEQKSSDFAWQKTVIPGPHHIFNPDNFYVFSFGKS